MAINVEKYMKLVNYVVAREFNYGNGFTQYGMTNEDIFQSGCLGLVKASKKYDDSYNNKFEAFARHYIRGEIFKSLRDSGMLIKFPRDAKELATKLRRLDETPSSAEEIMELFDVDHYKADLALKLVSLKLNSGDQSYESNGEKGLTIFDTVSDGYSLEDEVVDCYKKEELDERLSVLTKREREVVELRLKGKDQKDISNTLNISQSNVSRALTRSVKKINEKFNGGK